MVLLHNSLYNKSLIKLKYYFIKISIKIGILIVQRCNIFLTKIYDKVKNKLFILDNGQIHKK